MTRKEWEDKINTVFTDEAWNSIVEQIKPGMIITEDYNKEKIIGKIISAEQIGQDIKIVGEIKDMDVGLRFGYDKKMPQLDEIYNIKKLRVLDFGLFKRE